MGSDLATMILTLLLAARFCDSAAINAADVDRCRETKEAGRSWNQFCGWVLNRLCHSAMGSEPSCGECQEGFSDHGSAACIAIEKCRKDDGSLTTEGQKCETLQRLCRDGTAGSHMVQCGACKDGFAEDPEDTEDPKKCIAAHLKSCHDQKEGWRTFEGFCYELSRTCVDSPYPYEDPKCGDCLDGYVPDDWNNERCTPKGIEKCYDVDGSLTKEGQECDTLKRLCSDGTSGSNKVQCGYCKAGFIEDPDDAADIKRCIVPVKLSCDAVKQRGQSYKQFCKQSDQMCETATAADKSDPDCKFCPAGQTINDQFQCADRISCDAEKEAGKTWKSFCADSNLKCKTSTAPGLLDPVCMQCPQGQTINAQFECQARTSCDAVNWIGKTWKEFCADSNSMCATSTASGRFDPVCTPCPQGQTINAQFECQAVYFKKCDDHKEGWMTFKDYCYDLNRTCVDSPFEGPKCGDCLDGYVPDDWNHERCIPNAVGCPAIHEIQNGVIQGACQTAGNWDVCLFYCYEGFLLEGSKGITCREKDGIFNWDSPPPVCKEIKIRTCYDHKEGWMTFRDFCYNLNRTCVDSPNPYFDPKCGDCLDGYVPDEWDKELCILASGCPAIHGVVYGKLEGRCQEAVLGDVCAITCNSGYVMEGSGRLFCKEMDGKFQWDSPLPNCRAAKCTDWKNDTGETWDLFCQMQENRECLNGTTSGQPPRCSCKAGCKEKADGTCVCEDNCDQKDKHRYLLKGFFSVLLERQ